MLLAQHYYHHPEEHACYREAEYDGGRGQKEKRNLTFDFGLCKLLTVLQRVGAGIVAQGC